MTITAELAQQQLDAYNARDIELFAACFAEDVQLIRLQKGEVFCDGRAQLRQIYGKMFTELPNLHCRLIHRVVCGEIAIDEEEVVGTHSGEVLHAVAIYEVRSEIITRAWFARDESFR